LAISEHLTIEGLGVSVLAPSVLSTEIKLGKLAVIDVPRRTPVNNYVMLHPADDRTSRCQDRCTHGRRDRRRPSGIPLLE
jgi:hypothetical protein